MVNVKVYHTLECAVKAQSRRKRYSCAPSLTSVLDGGGCQSQATAVFFPPGNYQILVVQEATCAPGSVRTSAENFAPIWIRFPDRPACSESLYRLSYPGPRE